MLCNYYNLLLLFSIVLKTYLSLLPLLLLKQHFDIHYDLSLSEDTGFGEYWKYFRNKKVNKEERYKKLRWA